MSNTRSSRRTLRPILLLVALLCVLLVLLLKEHIERQVYPRHYTDYVSQYAEQYGVPEHIVYAVIRTESNFDARAVSSAGAVGLMQITPDTFRWLTGYHLKENLSTVMCYDAKTNIRYGVYYLSFLYERYDNWTAALAAYNAGPGRVDQWLQEADLVDAGGHLIPERIPFRETRDYVHAVEQAGAMYEQLYNTHSENSKK